MSLKLENATRLYMEGIRDGKAHYAVTTYTGERYTQHSTGVRNGVEGFLEFFGPFLERNPVRDIRIIRSVVDGQYVFLQVFQDINNGQAKWVTTDMFDTDQNDKIIEHWDVISPYEDGNSTDNDQIAGPTEVQDEAATHQNKEIVRNFMCDVMVLGETTCLESFMDRDALTVHSSSDTGSFEEYTGTYDMVFKILGQGNFVVAYSRVIKGEQALARFDLMRLSNGKIVEIWINQETILPKSEWGNGGKF